VPDGTVGLITEDLGERGIRGLPLRDARFLTNGGAYQRMAEPELAAVDFDQLCGDRRSHVSRPDLARQQRGGFQDLAQRLAVIHGGHQQRGAHRRG
jgi:hypothetical protein